MEGINNILGFVALMSVIILIHVKLLEFYKRTEEMQESVKDEISIEDLRLINKILKEKRMKYEIIRRD